MSNFGCLFTFCYSIWANKIKNKLQTCNLQICESVLIGFAPSKQQKVNKHPKLNNNFNIRCQLEHFEDEMRLTQVINSEIIGYLRFFFQTEFPIFKPSSSFGRPQWPWKWPQQNLVKLGKWKVFSWNKFLLEKFYREVEWFCLLRGIYARFSKKMADFLLLICSQTLRGVIWSKSFHSYDF